METAKELRKENKRLKRDIDRLSRANSELINAFKEANRVFESAVTKSLSMTLGIPKSTPKKSKPIDWSKVIFAKLSPPELADALREEAKSLINNPTTYKRT